MLPTSVERAGTVDAAALYEDLRQELIDILRAASDDELERTVAATPAWRVRDVLAHVTGITYDLNRQDLAGDTDRQVARHRDDPVETVIAEWDREAPAFEEGLRLFGYPLGSHFVADLHAHLQDIRTALGLSRHDDPATVLVALDFYLDDLDQGLRADEGGSITITAGEEVHVVGSGSPAATLAGGPFEILRCLSGRRSLAQIEGLEWSGARDDLASRVSRYPLPVADLPAD
jgi:uncharacterized protein (TIGR03083 family)